MNADRPLDGIRSIKVKLGLLVAVSVVAAALVSLIGDRAGVPAWLTVPVTVAAALGVTQWLARGMTSPLREMTEATGRMATGDYSRRVTTTSADEVGELASAFNTMAADLSDADRQRRQLVATVSHELRTPLAAQQALLENLVDGVVTPDDVVLRTALAQAERLGSLVGDLLDLSRLDGGRTALVLAPVDVRSLVEAAVAEAGVSRRGTVHLLDVPADLHVTADAARLAQVLANLIDNADRHSPSSGHVTVTAGIEDPDRWWLVVADEGSGLPDAEGRRIFEGFGAGEDSGGGTGIGLAIASWVCELHGGSITSVTPPAGERGARLRVVLPRSPRPADGASDAVTVTTADRSSAPPPATPATTSPARMHKERPMPATVPTASRGGVSTFPGVPIEQPKPVIDSLFGDLWPETGLGPQPRLLFASVAVGVLAGLVLPYGDLGVAVLAVLLSGAVVVWSASRRRTTRWSLLTAALCVGLASFAVLRAADWLTVLAVLLGIVLTTTALTDARGLLAIVVGALSWPFAALRGLPLLGRTLSATSRVPVLWPVVRTAAISLVALVVFGGLFASGDAVFGSWASSLMPRLAWDGLILRFFVGAVVAGSLLAATYVALNPPRVQRVVASPARAVARLWEWVVPVGIVVALVAAFVVAQAAALFGGHAYVSATTGLTYAEYVHEGFGQLTAATVLTLATVALTVRKAPRATGRERLVLRVMLGALCVLTLVVVASALHRMDLYQQAYGFTVLRLVVDALELWLGLLVLLVLVAGIRLSARWLPRMALGAAAALLLGGGLANPEAWVAQRNIDRLASTGTIDLGYLRSLGPDATPTIAAGLPAALASCVLHERPADPDERLLTWNLGRSRAASALAALPVSHDATECTTWLDIGYSR